MIIGVDFDNTLVSYDEVLAAIARERGFAEAAAAGGKRAIRDRIRLLPNGEVEWQKCQALLYGPRIGEAKLMPGARDFFRECARRGIAVWVVSHKTNDLREAALGWMEANGWARERVIFAATRAEKIARIRDLGCTHFVDDLVEVLEDEAFPAGTERILFGADTAPAGVRLARNWWEVGEQILGWERVGGGRNSQVWRIGDRAVKVYFRHPSDSRDRMKTEFGALRFLWECGERSIPEPIETDAEQGRAMYEWIEGSPVEASDEAVDDATAFLKRLKEYGGAAGASELGVASEACFSGEEIVGNLRARLERLAGIPELEEFLCGQFEPALQTLCVGLEARVTKTKILSPSDFGFHNALRRVDGKIIYLDFEYFGWDDPAKMISDFLLHPAMSLTDGQKRRFLDAFPEWRDRVVAHYPLFGLKWSLILLNEFLPDERLRRRFAGSDQTRAGQLEKAQAMLRRVMSEYERFPY